METNWKMIYSTRDPLKAELAKNLLNRNNIEAVELNKRDSCHGNFGDIEVYCHADHVVLALHVLNKLDHE